MSIWLQTNCSVHFGIFSKNELFYWTWTKLQRLRIGLSPNKTNFIQMSHKVDTQPKTHTHWHAYIYARTITSLPFLPMYIHIQTSRRNIHTHRHTRTHAHTHAHCQTNRNFKPTVAIITIITKHWIRRENVKRSIFDTFKGSRKRIVDKRTKRKRS